MKLVTDIVLGLIAFYILYIILIAIVKFINIIFKDKDK